LIRSHFQGRVTAKGYSKEFGKGSDWPPYSPDLNPMDYYMWGNVKDKVYKDKPKTLSEFKSKIVV